MENSLKHCLLSVAFDLLERKERGAWGLRWPTLHPPARDSEWGHVEGREGAAESCLGALRGLSLLGETRLGASMGLRLFVYGSCGPGSHVLQCLLMQVG